MGKFPSPPLSPSPSLPSLSLSPLLLSCSLSLPLPSAGASCPPQSPVLQQHASHPQRQEPLYPLIRQWSCCCHPWHFTLLRLIVALYMQSLHSVVVTTLSSSISDAVVSLSSQWLSSHPAISCFRPSPSTPSPIRLHLFLLLCRATAAAAALSFLLGTNFSHAVLYRLR